VFNESGIGWNEGERKKVKHHEECVNFPQEQIECQKRGHVPTALRDGRGMDPAAAGIWTTWDTDWNVGPWNVCPDGAWVPAGFWFPACIPSVSLPGWAWYRHQPSSKDIYCIMHVGKTPFTDLQVCVLYQFYPQIKLIITNKTA